MRLYEKPPTIGSAIQPAQGEFKISQLKEHDLIFMTEKPLPVDRDGKFEMQNLANLDFLRRMLFEPGSMLAFVKKKACSQKGGGMGPALILVHPSKVIMLDDAQDYMKLFCYHFESMATTIREFRTIKSCEFFRNMPMLMDPSIEDRDFL